MIRVLRGTGIRGKIMGLLLILLPPVLLFGAMKIQAYGRIEKVRLADGRFLGSASVNAAVEKGFFRKEGLEISRSLFVAGKESLNAVLAGKADLCTVSDFPFVMEAMKGTKTYIIATLAIPQKTYAIIARKDQGISSPNDLQGKKIGLTFGTNLHFILDSFLLFHRIPRKDIRLIDIPVDRMPEVLRKGDLQAVIAWEPFSSQIRTQVGTNAVVFSGDELYIYRVTWNLVGMKEFIHKNPETIKRVLRGLLKSGDFIKGNRSEALEMTAGFMGMEKEALRESWETFTPNLSLSPLLVENLENETRWAIRNKLVSPREMPNYLDYISFDGLKSVKRDGVTILHKRVP